MATDTNRAAFVQQQYRHATALSAAVRARNPSAQTAEINTNLDEATAENLAAAILAENDKPRVYEVVLEGVTFLDTFVDGVPRFIADFPKMATDERTLKLVGFTTDYETNTTTLQVRG
jgi:hypothetical protein